MMNLECLVVKDLYVLYKENELSEEVRKAVECHLEGCSDCKSVYENEINFQDIIKNDVDEQPSKKMDDRMMMKFKIMRLKIAAAFIAAIFLVSIYYSYSQSRLNLLYDVSQAEETMYDLSLQIGNIKDDNATLYNFAENIDSINRQNNIVMRDLNFVENNRLKNASNDLLFLNFKLNSMVDILKTRHKNGTFSEKDEKAVLMLRQYMDDVLKLLSTEKLNLSKHHSSSKSLEFFNPMDVRNISECFNHINQLALMYTDYGKFPDEITPLSEDIIRERIQSVLDIGGLDVKLKPYMDSSIRLNGSSEFDMFTADKTQYGYGTIDAYTGRLIEIHMTNPKTQGELLKESDIKNNLISFLGREYGKEQGFDIKYMGINYHFDSNVDIKLYSYEIHPVYKGYKVVTPFNIFFDARTGSLYGLMKNSQYDFVKPDYDIDTSISISPELGLKNQQLKVDTIGNYKYVETSIIKSKLTGKYVLVHIYDNGNRIYINTATGKQEYSY